MDAFFLLIEGEDVMSFFKNKKFQASAAVISAIVLILAALILLLMQPVHLHSPLFIRVLWSWKMAAVIW